MKNSKEFKELYPQFSTDKRLSKEQKEAIKLIYDVTDGLTDFHPDIFEDDSIAKVYGVAFKAMFDLANEKAKPEPKKEEPKTKPEPKNEEPKADKPKAKFEVGQEVMLNESVPVKVKLTKLVWVESRKTYSYSYKTKNGGGNNDEAMFSKIVAKPKPETKSGSQSNNQADKEAKAAKAKEDKKAKDKEKFEKEESKRKQEEFTGKLVRKESDEMKFVKRFLAIRKSPERNLCVTAYKALNKAVVNGSLKKSGANNPDLIYAIQQSYYDAIIGKANSLKLSDKLLADAEAFVGSQKVYDTVKYLSEFTGWAGASKSQKQIDLFVKKAENAVALANPNDPFYSELKKVVANLKDAKEGDVIVPDAIGLQGILQGIKITK